MSKQYTSNGKRLSSMAHAKHYHKCSICGFEVMGNGFYRHFRHCILNIYPDLYNYTGKDLRRAYSVRKQEEMNND